ncbi:hypothetical protein CSKR_109287 [Clonorchis sinensis]|uniref:Fukutin-related protein n=1 Tax=Clonorchis sinensis TaxID=79923 RepID=A0A3R7DFW9_CLOSI|nr:hypothetical protein CSKR_109287 [Clonorchis sinensis]
MRKIDLLAKMRINRILLVNSILFLTNACLTIWIFTQRQSDEIILRNDNYIIGHDLLYSARRKLTKAFRAARSGETRLLIEETLQILGPTRTPNFNLSAVSDAKQRPEVCPEYWGDVREDKVYFEDVYKTVNCDRIPLEDLLEILLYADSCADGKYLVDRIRVVYPTVHIHLALGAESVGSACKQLRNVRVYTHEKDNGAMWLKLSRFSRKKYVLVGRNMVDFTHYTDIDRMLRVMNSLQVDVVGGAVRLEPEGRWYAGCYQSTIRNFTLRIHPGHDQSAQSCAYCDYIASPFVIRRSLLQTAMGNSLFSGPVAFVQMFMESVQRTGRQTMRTVACVDVLFHVAGRVYGSRSYGIAETPKSGWLELAKQLILNRIVLPGNIDHQWTCDQVDIECVTYQTAGLVLPGCCIQELAHCLKGFLVLADKHNVSTFLVGGTLLGTVKIYGGFLPWERDADLVWDAYKFPVVGGPIKTSLHEVYRCEMGELQHKTKFGLNITACSKVTNNSCLYHPLRSKSWRIELYGDPIIAASRLWGLKNTTKVNLNGMWVTSPPNPGRYVRHTYGDNILGHVQHWLDYGLSTGWARYTNVENSEYMPCPQRFVRHSCLRGNYLPHGDIQFQDSPL